VSVGNDRYYKPFIFCIVQIVSVAGADTKYRFPTDTINTFCCSDGRSSSHLNRALYGSATALITIQKGEVSAQLLKSELTHILLVEWEWEVQEHGENAYIMPFPCKIELDWMVAIRTVITKQNEGDSCLKSTTQRLNH
jgi:hypothetical protein